MTSECGQREREAFEVTSVCFVTLSGIDLPGGAAHFAAVSPTTGLEDSCAGGKSPRSVLTNTVLLVHVNVDVNSTYLTLPSCGDV